MRFRARRKVAKTLKKTVKFTPVGGALFRFTRSTLAVTFPVTAWSQGREKRSIMETRKKKTIPALTPLS
jgi:hypothetical protein